MVLVNGVMANRLLPFASVGMFGAGQGFRAIRLAMMGFSPPA